MNGVDLLRDYAKEITEMLKRKGLIIPDIWFNVHSEITFLERFCHLNGLKKEFEVIWDKYKDEIRKVFFSLEVLGIE
jgi:hypothetical protein